MSSGVIDKGWARPLSGVFVTGQFTINVTRRSFHSLLIFLFTVLSPHSFVHSYDPHFYFFLSIEIFYFPATSFPRTTQSSNHVEPIKPNNC